MAAFTFLPRSLKDRARAGLARLGYGLQSLDRVDRRYSAPSFDTGRALPPGAAEYLRRDHPRLLELSPRYSAVRTPLRAHSTWDDAYLARELALEHFRGDNAYLWQFRNAASDAERKYYLFARYLETLDHRGLLRSLGKEGLFGCWTFEFRSLPLFSLDLLDSINEMYFLDRHCGLFDRRDFNVLDIGAGYGRLAHRMTAATRLSRYYCVDAIPQSTFLSEYYLRFRGCDDRAVVVPLDELDRGLPAPGKIEFAINVHSFSEMPAPATTGWLQLVSELQIPWLMIVPDPGEDILSYETDHSRRDLMPALNALGYRLKVREPVVLDPDIRRLMGVGHHFFLLERVR